MQTQIQTRYNFLVGDDMKTITIGTNDARTTSDKFLIKTFPNLIKSMLYKKHTKKDIKCNGKRCEISRHL